MRQNIDKYRNFFSWAPIRLSRRRVRQYPQWPQSTSFFTVKDDMIHAGALWLDELVVVDGNLVTSRKLDDLPDFMKAVISSLKQTLGASR